MMGRVAEETPDPVLQALDALLHAARRNVVGWMTAMERIDHVRAQRARGTAYRDMALSAAGERLLDVVTDNQERLTTAAAQLRRALAQQLHEEGMSTAEIARSFRVSRQRVSALLQGEAQRELREEPPA